MLKTIGFVFLSVGAVVEVAMAAAPPATTPPAAASVQQQARVAARRAVTMPYQKVHSVQGVAAGYSDPATKKIWVTALNATGAADAAEAGFRLAAISVSAAMPGATVKATFNVQAVTDQVTLKLYAGDITDPGPSGWASTTVSSTASNVQLTTDAFTLQPGKSYVVTAVALVRPDATADKAAHAVVKLTDLKWEF
jgi:hypothetical protein